MGRAGGGGGGRSGGSRSSSRSSGSFRSSGGSLSGGGRAGGGDFSSRPSFGGGGGYHHRPPHHHHHYGGTRTVHHYHEGSGHTSLASTIFAWLIVLFIVVATLHSMGVFSGGNHGGKSTIERTRVESGLSYDTNVVITDETGWIENKGQVGRELREFWDKTGVQPYIMMLTYDENLKTDADKEAYTEVLYEENIDREDAILFVYYGERDLEGDVGLMCYTLGKQAASVFDGEAIDIWFNNIDYYWYGDGTMTDVYIKAYNTTAKTIMGAPTNGWDFLKVVAIGAVIIIVLFIGYKALKSKFKRDAEEAKETERILNATMGTLGEDNTVGNDLLDKYK